MSYPDFTHSWLKDQQMVLQAGGGLGMSVPGAVGVLHVDVLLMALPLAANHQEPPLGLPM